MQGTYRTFSGQAGCSRVPLIVKMRCLLFPILYQQTVSVPIGFRAGNSPMQETKQVFPVTNGDEAAIPEEQVPVALPRPQALLL